MYSKYHPYPKLHVPSKEKSKHEHLESEKDHRRITYSKVQAFPKVSLLVIKTEPQHVSQDITLRSELK
jgi:hypothetical protein